LYYGDKTKAYFITHRALGNYYHVLMGKKKLSIFLYTGYTPRASALMNRIEKACGSDANISLIDSEASILEKRTGHTNSVVILDLPNIKQPAIKSISKVKASTTKTKVVAIHIYTTKLLIDPLLEAGIDGYLPYEPEPAQLRSAIEAVIAGETYLPPGIYA